MQTGIFDIIANKIISGIIAVGSLFYSTITGVNPAFTEIKLHPSVQSLFVSAQLNDCFSSDFDEILTSGQIVTIKFELGVYRINKQKLNPYKKVLECKFHHDFKYHLIDKYFSVTHSETNNEKLFSSVEDAKEYLSFIPRVFAVNLKDIQSNKRYFIKLKASMKSISLPAINEEIITMLYWNSIHPEITTPIFTEEIFRQ